MSFIVDGARARIDNRHNAVGRKDLTTVTERFKFLRAMGNAPGTTRALSSAVATEIN